MTITPHPAVGNPRPQRAQNSASKASGVRPFTADDVAPVSELHRRANGVSDADAPSLIGAYREFFSDVFLPAAPVGGLRSLVYQENDGTIVGFQGIHGRRMIFED